MSKSNEYLNYTTLNVVPRPATNKFSLYKKNARLWMSAVLGFSDTITLLLVYLAATNIHLGTFDPLNIYFYFDFLWIPVLLLVVIYASFGLYPGIGLSAVEEVRRLSLSTSLLFLIIITLTFLLKTTENYSRIVIVVTWMTLLVLVPLTRNLIRRFFCRLKVWGEPVGVVGFPDRRVAEVADFFIKFPQKGVKPKVIFIDGKDRPSETSHYQIIPPQNIVESAKILGIKTVLVVVPNWNLVSENIDKYRYIFKRVILIRQQKASYSLSDSIPLDFNGFMGVQVCHNLLNPWSMVLKRFIDLAVSGILLVVLSPLVALISLLIHFNSPGGIYYRQDRLCKGGKKFKVLKFRTMYVNGDQIFKDLLKEDEKIREEWNKYQKIKTDPRITRVGAFLRKYSLDELPQLWNIFKGEMSLVGPRPIMVSQKEMYGRDFHDYSQVRPGVTGLWQVSGRNHTTYARRVELDMEYIQRWSIWLDIYIIFQTVKEVYTHHGAC